MPSNNALGLRHGSGLAGVAGVAAPPLVLGVAATAAQDIGACDGRPLSGTDWPVTGAAAGHAMGALACGVGGTARVARTAGIAGVPCACGTAGVARTAGTLFQAEAAGPGESGRDTGTDANAGVARTAGIAAPPGCGMAGVAGIAREILTGGEGGVIGREKATGGVGGVTGGRKTGGATTGGVTAGRPMVTGWVTTGGVGGVTGRLPFPAWTVCIGNSSVEDKAKTAT